MLASQGQLRGNNGCVSTSTAPWPTQGGAGHFMFMDAAFWLGLVGAAGASVLASVRRLARRGCSWRFIGGVVGMACTVVAAQAWYIGSVTGMTVLAAAIVQTGVVALWIFSKTAPVRGKPAAVGLARLPVHWVYYGAAGVLCMLGWLLFLQTPAAGGLDGLALLIMLAWAGWLVIQGRRMQRQLQSPRLLSAALAADPRPPVLYLREFGREMEPFSTAEPPESGRVPRALLRHDLSGFETLEDFLG